MKLTRREFIQAAGLVTGAAAIELGPVLAANGGAMQSPVINPVFLTGSTDTWPLAELAEMGYKGLEVTPACLGKPRTYEMPVACVNASPELTPYLTGSLHDGVERRRRTTIDHLLGVLKTMNTEGIPMLVIAPGRLAENYQTVDQARALLVSSAKELSDAAGDVAVLIASAPRRLFARSGELAGVIDDIGRPNVAAALDVGHAMLSGETPGDAARALGSRLRYVQVHDADVRPGMPRIDRHLPMGNGSAKREDLVDILKGRVVAITVTAPNDPIGSARESLKWIHA